MLGKLSGEMNPKGDRAEGRVRFGKDKAGASGIPFPNKGWGQNARFLQKLTHGTQRAEQLLKSPSGMLLPRGLTMAPQVSGCDLKVINCKNFATAES